jgi:hypothetical protein
MEIEEEDSPIDLSALTIVENYDTDEITMEHDSVDEYDTSTDEDECFTEEEEDDGRTLKRFSP